MIETLALGIFYPLVFPPSIFWSEFDSCFVPEVRPYGCQSFAHSDYLLANPADEPLWLAFPALSLFFLPPFWSLPTTKHPFVGFGFPGQYFFCRWKDARVYFIMDSLSVSASVLSSLGTY